MHEHVGTKVGGYMAPELVERQPYDGCAADIWSAGAVLFVMLAGVPPMEEAVLTDWYFVQIRNKRWKRFWKQHNNPVFDKSHCKDLFVGIFETDFSKRHTIEMIRKTDWHTAKTYSDDDLRLKMMERFKQIRESGQSPIDKIHAALIKSNPMKPRFNES